MKKIGKNLLAFGILSAIFAPIAYVSAQISYDSNDPFGTGYGSYIGLGTQDIRETIAKIIQIILGVLGIVVTLIIIAGGFRWMTAGGNEESVAQAKKIISAGIIGLIIILLAYAISSWVFNALRTVTTDSDQTGQTGMLLKYFI